MLPFEQNYKIYYAELLAIVEDFKTWRHYLKAATHSILVLIAHNNLKNFEKITHLSSQQIWYFPELLQYNFKIHYHIGSNNPANALSWPLKEKVAEKKLAKQNRKILDKIQQSLSKNNHPLLNTNYPVVMKPTICDKDNYFWEYCTQMLKIVIVGTITSPKIKKL